MNKELHKTICDQLPYEVRVEIPGVEVDHYMINRIGQLFSYAKGKRYQMKPYPIKNGGYLIYGMKTTTNKKKFMLAHRLVALAFIPNPENKRTVNHINGVKTDNRVENLEWATDSENIKHAYENGLMPNKTFRELYNSKLNEDQVLEIRRQIKSGKKQRDIARAFNVIEQTISSIKHNRSYTSVPDELVKYTDEFDYDVY